MRNMASSVTACKEAAKSLSRCVSGDSGWRGGPREQLVKATRGHRQALTVVEVAHVHAQRTIFFQIDQNGRESSRDRAAGRRGQAHHFVFTAVDAKAQVVCERRIKQAQRMWIYALL